MSLCKLWFDCDEHFGRLKLYSTYLICDCLLYYLVLLLNWKCVVPYRRAVRECVGLGACLLVLERGPDHDLPV